MTLRTLNRIYSPLYYLKMDYFHQEIIAQKLGRAMATTTFKELTRI